MARGGSKKSARKGRQELRANSANLGANNDQPKETEHTSQAGNTAVEAASFSRFKRLAMDLMIAPICSEGMPS